MFTCRQISIIAIFVVLMCGSLQVYSFSSEEIRLESQIEKLEAQRYEKWIKEENVIAKNLGKSMIDIHGNRVRAEEYLFWPNTNKIKVVNLTKRGERFDWGYAILGYNRDLPPHDFDVLRWETWYHNIWPGLLDGYEVDTEGSVYYAT